MLAACVVVCDLIVPAQRRFASIDVTHQFVVGHWLDADAGQWVDLAQCDLTLGLNRPEFRVELRKSLEVVRPAISERPVQPEEFGANSLVAPPQVPK
jgi:hypothetical protein